MKKLLLLVNTHSGRGDIQGMIGSMIDYYNKNDFEVTVYITQRRAHATDILLKNKGRSGLFSHGVLLSQMQNKIIVLPVVHWESKQASTLAGCWPAAYDLGTKCPKVFLTVGSAAPAPVGLS